MRWTGPFEVSWGFLRTRVCSHSVFQQEERGALEPKAWAGFTLVITSATAGAAVATLNDRTHGGMCGVWAPFVPQFPLKMTSPQSGLVGL